MSDQEPKRKAGPIRQYATLGKTGATRTPERSDVQESQRPDAQTPRQIDTQASERPDIKEQEHPGVRATDLPTGKAQTPRRLDAQKEERVKHTIYLPQDLSKWVKHRAVDQECEISEVFEEAIKHYKTETEQ